MTRLSLPIIRCMVNSSVSGEASKVLTSTARVLPFISDPPTRLRAMQEFLEGARSLDLNEQAGLLRELPIAEVGRGLNTVQLCNMTAFVGSAYCHLENRDVAQGLYIQATRLMEQVQDPAGLLFCYLSLAPLEMDLEDWGMLPKFTAPTGMTVEVATLDEASLEKVPTQVMEKTRKNLWDVGICHGIHEAMLVPAIRAFHTQEPETPVMILTVRRPLWWQTALNFKVSFTQMEANWSTPEALPMDPQVLHFAVLAFIEGAGRSLVIVDSLADLKKALPFSQVMELVQTFRDLTQKAKAGLLFSVDQHSFTEEEQLVLASKIQMLEI